MITLNPLIGAAVCGAVFVELLAINRRSNEKNFRIGYYLRKNKYLIASNVVGALTLYFAAPAITIGLAAWVQTFDMLAMRQVSDALILPFTGMVIGTSGSALLRYAIDKRKAVTKRKRDA